jgi:DNA-binding SARP family transcriptional activator/tetratricopeptide (TPR) repeat protein
MQFSVLGTLEVQRDGEVCDLGAPKQRALLARLLLDVNRPVSVDRLIDDLWGGAPPGRATASLQAYVSNLRRILEPDRPARSAASVLVTQPPGYALRVAPDTIDAVRFRDLAAAAADELDAGEPDRAHATADAALSLWRGPALADVADEPFAGAEIVRLEELQLSVQEVRLAAALDLGRVGAVTAELEALIAREPLRERLWELLILALYRSGRTADALDRYQRVRQLLDIELGLDPGPALRELEQAVLDQDPALLPSPLRRPRTDAAADEAPPRTAVHAADVPRLDASGRPPLVGRDAELVVLDGMLTATETGVPRWTLLTGEEGMGKTRLAEAVRERAGARGWQVATARCHDDADTPAHWVWAQVLRQLPAASADTDPFAALTAEVRAQHGEGDGARFALYKGVQRALVAATRTSPLLVLLDDLQWADVDSLRTVRFLSVELREVPVAVLATVRDGEGGSVLHDVLGTVDRQPGSLRLPISPIGAAAIRTIAEAVTGEEVGIEVAERLHERSGGNPFFATELARLAGSSGASSAPLPSGVRATIRRRLDRLPSEIGAVLALAAVLGLAFDTSVLAAASEQDLPELLDRLDPALATGLLVEDDMTMRLRFAHALLRDELLAPLTAAQRQRLHARVARALHDRAATDERALPELAHHLVEAGPMGDPAVAVEAARQAGDAALRRVAFDDAATWFDRALRVVPLHEALHGPDPRHRHRLLVAKGSALYRAGRAPEARSALVDAIDVAAALADLEAVTEAATSLGHTGGIWSWVDLGQLPADVLGRLEQALEAVGPDDSSARARLLSLLAAGAYFGGDPQRIERLSADALAMARRVGDPGTLADVLLDRSYLLWGPDRCEEALALADEALDLEGLTDLQRVVIHGRRFVPLLFSGDVPAAVQAHAHATALARDAQLLAPLMQLAHLPVALATTQGRFDEAEALIAESRTLEERGDVPIISEAIVSLELMLHHHRGLLGDRIELLTELTSILPIRTTWQLLAVAQLQAGQPTAAAATLQTSTAAPSVRWMELLADAVEAEIRAQLPPSDQAVDLADALIPYEPMIASAGTTYWWAPVALPLARLELRLGRLDEAEARLRRCIERSQSWGTHVWTVQAQWHLAAVLCERGAAEEEAATLRTAALATAREIGMALPEVPSARQVAAAGTPKPPTG